MDAPVESGATTPDDPADLAALAAHAVRLADGVAAALGPWVRRSVAETADRWRPGSSHALADAAGAAADAAVAEVAPRVRALLDLDVDRQATGPLAIVREAVRHPTEVLARAGVPPGERDEFAVRAFPEDRYGLAPAAFEDLDPALRDLGLVWGAAKAHVVLRRRRAEGRR